MKMNELAHVISCGTGYPGNNLSVGCNFHFSARYVYVIKHSLTVFYLHPKSRKIICLAFVLTQNWFKIFGLHSDCVTIKSLNKTLWLETILAHPQISDNGAWLPKGKANDFVTGFIYLGKNLWILCQQPLYTFPQLSFPFFRAVVAKSSNMKC